MESKKRHKYTIAYKLQVIQYAKENGNRAAARHFGSPPTEKMIRFWRKQEEKLQKAVKSKHGLRTKKAKWVELEEEMKAWVVDQRNQGAIVTTKQIIFEAKERATAKGYDDFGGNEGWCYRFMKRNGLAMRTKTKISQKMPMAYENKILEFHKYVINLRKDTHFEMGQIANMDEVPLSFDVPSNKTVDFKGSKTVTIKTSGHEKTHFTAVLACCADGTKLPPFLIFKRKTFPKESIPPGIFIHVHPKGWMDEDGVKLWLDKVWSRRPGGLIKKTSLLVWDQFRAHLTQATKNRVHNLNTKVAVIPGGLTCQLQPLDVCINKPFKVYVREEWNAWMRLPQHDKTPSGFIKKPTIAQVCQWVKIAWDKVKTETVVLSFKKCGISNDLEGIEDDLLYEGSDSSTSSSDSGELEECSTDDSDNDFVGFGCE